MKLEIGDVVAIEGYNNEIDLGIVLSRNTDFLHYQRGLEVIDEYPYGEINLRFDPSRIKLISKADFKLELGDVVLIDNGYYLCMMGEVVSIHRNYLWINVGGDSWLLENCSEFIHLISKGDFK